MTRYFSLERSLIRQGARLKKQHKKFVQDETDNGLEPNILGW